MIWYRYPNISPHRKDLSWLPFPDYFTVSCSVPAISGFPAEPGNLEILILSVQVQKWPGICPQKRENLDKTGNLAENLDKTWNVKIYKISILYWDNFFRVLYSCDFRTSLVSAFWCQIVHTITWRMTFLTWTKPGDNLEFYDLNKLGTLHMIYPVMELPLSSWKRLSD